MVFNQSPQDKKQFIRKLQKGRDQVLMLGDGLNDAGALKEAAVGLAVTENNSHFFPACDGLLSADNLYELDDILNYSRWTMKVIRFNLVISVIYNTIGITLAATGVLTPVICAILMPASSLSIMLLSALGTWLGARRCFKEKTP